MEKDSAINIGELMLFLVLINLLIFITIAILHEAGHVIVGVLEGCTDIRIVIYKVSTGGTFTTMECPGGFPVDKAVIGSFIFVLPVSLLFLMLKGYRSRFIGFVMIGGHLVGSFADLRLIGFPVSVSVLVGVVGFLFVVLGEDRMIEHLLDHKFFTAKYKRRHRE